MHRWPTGGASSSGTPTGRLGIMGCVNPDLYSWAVNTLTDRQTIMPLSLPETLVQNDQNNNNNNRLSAPVTTVSWEHTAGSSAAGRSSQRADWPSTRAGVPSPLIGH